VSLHCSARNKDPLDIRSTATTTSTTCTTNMGSPRKNESPGLSRASAGNPRRKRHSSSNSKKSDSSAPGFRDGSFSPRAWTPRKQIGGGDLSQDSNKGPSVEGSNSSSSPQIRQRTVPATPDDLPLMSPNAETPFYLSDFDYKENLAELENDVDDTGIPVPPGFAEKIGGYLPRTPPSTGYRSLPAPSPRARFTLSRIRTPLSLKTMNNAQESPSTLSSLSVTRQDLNLPQFDRNGGGYFFSDDPDPLPAPSTPPPPQSKAWLAKAIEAKKSTQKRSNIPRKERHFFIFPKRNSYSGKSKSNTSSNTNDDEQASPLISPHSSLSDKIRCPNFASDRSETIVLVGDGESAGDRFKAYEGEGERGEFVEVVQLREQERGDPRPSIGNDSDQDDLFALQGHERAASELHSLCGCMTTVDDVARAKSFFEGGSPEDASRRDYKGETPLHAFSNNKALAVNMIGSPGNVEFETRDYLTLYRQPTYDQESSSKLHEIVEEFMLEDLLPSFPGACLIEDNNGHIPFEAGLLDWIATSHNENLATVTDQDYAARLSTYTNAVSDAVSNAWKSTSTTFLTAVSKMTESERLGGVHGDIEKGVNPAIAGYSGSFRQSSSKMLTGSTNGSSLIVKSRLSPHARFCLEMLSLIVDQLEKITNISSRSQESQQDAGIAHMCRRLSKLHDMYGPLDLTSRVVEHISSMPRLLETIFYISDDHDIEFVLSTSIIRRVITDKHSVGPWITSMLQHPKRCVSLRAIEYLQVASNLCHQDLKKKRPRGTSPSSNALIDEVSSLRDFIPSLLSLDVNDIEDVSTTYVVKKVLDNMISKPFVATVVLCDALFLGLMIVGFRYAVNGMITGKNIETVLAWIYVANTGIFYFIIGEIGKVVSLCLLSKHSRRYFLSFWNLIDVLAILLATASSVAMRWQFAILEEGLDDTNILRGLLAITTGFLWLRVLSFLKAINIQLATFILAIITIARDVLFFCVILLILVVSFSQMFYTLLAPSRCATEGASEQPECKQTEYLLQVYIMLMGDFGNFERESYTTVFSIILFVLYSFVVAVILLNVLIAIASDSYEKCLLKSQKLFGRARVMLVAELASFQTLLRKRDPKGDASFEDVKRGEEGIYSKWWTSGSWTRNWSRGSVLFFGLSMFVTAIWTVAELVGFSRGEKNLSILFSLSSVFVNIALYIAIILFLDRQAATKRTGDEKNEWSNFLQRIVLRILGASREGTKNFRGKKKGQEEWYGRVQFLQREMDRIAERQTELVLEQSDNFHNMVNQSELRIRAELNMIEERFRQTNSNIVSAVDELKALISLAGSYSHSGHNIPVPDEVDVKKTR